MMSKITGVGAAIATTALSVWASKATLEQKAAVNTWISRLVDQHHEFGVVRTGLEWMGKCRKLMLQQGPIAVRQDDLFFNRYSAFPVFRGDSRPDAVIHFPPVFAILDFHGTRLFNVPRLWIKEEENVFISTSGLTSTSVDPVVSFAFAIGGRFGVYIIRPEESVVLSQYSTLDINTGLTHCKSEYEIAHMRGLFPEDCLFTFACEAYTDPVTDAISLEDCERLGIDERLSYFPWPKDVQLGQGIRDAQLKSTPITEQVYDIFQICCDAKSQICIERKQELIALRDRWLDYHKDEGPVDAKKLYALDQAISQQEATARLAARMARRQPILSIPPLSA